MYRKISEFLFKLCYLSHLGCSLMLGVWLSLLPLCFYFPPYFSYLPFPSLALALWHSAFLTMASKIFSLHPFAQTNAAAHTTRWRPGAQWWLSCMALSHVLNPACHSVEDRGRRSILSTATEQWWRPIEPKGADPRGGCTFGTRVLWAKTLTSLTTTVGTGSLGNFRFNLRWNHKREQLSYFSDSVLCKLQTDSNTSP